jgi:hypothetical protein
VICRDRGRPARKRAEGAKPLRVASLIFALRAHCGPDAPRSQQIPAGNSCEVVYTLTPAPAVNILKVGPETSIDRERFESRALRECTE